MILDWSDILPHAITSLSPLHQEIVIHILNQRGPRRPYAHALRQWSLNRKELDDEIDAAFDAIRRYLRRYGIRAASELEFT